MYIYMTQTRSILQSDFTMTKAKILETLEEKWNDIDRKAITYEVKHQETASFGHGAGAVFWRLILGKKSGKKGWEWFFGSDLWIFMVQISLIIHVGWRLGAGVATDLVAHQEGERREGRDLGENSGPLGPGLTKLLGWRTSNLVNSIVYGPFMGDMMSPPSMGIVGHSEGGGKPCGDHSYLETKSRS